MKYQVGISHYNIDMTFKNNITIYNKGKECLLSTL